MNSDCMTTQADFEADTLDWAKAIMTMQNECLFPDSGTLGFIMGCAMALGNTAAAYTQGLDRKQRKQFEKIVATAFHDSMKHPFVSGTINNA